MSINWSEKTKRRYLLELIRKIAVKSPDDVVEVPEGLKGFGTVIYENAKCIACGSCTRMCEDEAIAMENTFDLTSLKNLPEDSKATNRTLLAEFIDKLKMKEPEKPVKVPEGLLGIGTINLSLSRCIFCKECVRICQYESLSTKPEWDLKAILEEIQQES
ncbi:MAG: 4Fe-4S dicluster domain-containing protein [Candidatus Helarchaeota archaeon]|nr:4Fe-4S dicluster domain-containing protein [Candidatus Helarchaeota archaeon]